MDRETLVARRATLVEERRRIEQMLDHGRQRMQQLQGRLLQLTGAIGVLDDLLTERLHQEMQANGRAPVADVPAGVVESGKED